MKNIRFISIILFSFASHSLCAQEPVNRNYTTSDGLPSTNVYYVMQDSKGFIWFATDNGVSRFDGTQFKNYSVSDGLSDNSVLKIVEDAEGRLWFLTFNGKPSFYQNDKIYNHSNCEWLKKVNVNSYATSFYEDSKKNIWLGYGDYSIIRLAPDGTIRKIKSKFKSMLMWEDKDGQLMCLSPPGRLRISDTIKFVFPDVSCKMGILVAPDSLLIINTHGGLKTIGLSNKMISITNVPQYKAVDISNIQLDSKGNIWLSTLNGAVEFSKGVIQTTHEHIYFGDYSITSVFRDRNDNLWFSTIGNGAFMLPSLRMQVVDNKSGLVENNISAFAVLNDSTFMVGTLNGSIQLIEGKSVIKYNHSLMSPSGTINKIAKNALGDVYIATEGGIFKYSKGKFTTFKDPIGWNKTLSLLSNGEPIIGWGEGVKKVFGDSIVPIYYNSEANRVYTILQLHSNDFLLGTDKGLYRFKDNNMQSYSLNNLLLTHRINTIVLASDSTLWIGTCDVGLLSLKQGIVKSYTVKEHLLSNRCNDLFLDNNIIYVATDNGLNVVNTANKTVNINSYSIANGLISNHINQVGKINKHTIVLATDRGLVEFDDRKIPLSSISTPYINSLAVNDSLKPLSGRYTFRYNEDNIRVDFGAINFNSGGKIEYRYKLDGVDATWNYTSYTSVKYSYLHPGNYKFLVTTQNADGTWNPKTASFSFYIETPWWQTWWFRTAIGFSLIAIIYIIIRWRIMVYKQKINREKALAESELKAMRSQINPHFVYNSLNAIQDFILQNQKEDANLYLTKFATLMRSILTHSRSSYITLEEEITHLKLYLELEALRFNNKFKCEFIINNNIDTEDVNIPSMILQPYIENAVLHGVAGLEGDGLITIDFSLKDRFLICVIEDNGIGRKKATDLKKQRVWKEHKSLGMTVTQERINLLSNYQKQKINVEITDIADDKNKECGTRVTIYFSLLQ